MAVRSARRRALRPRYGRRQAASSTFMSGLARAGLLARGVMYGLIGVIAVQIALGDAHQQADRSGALRLVAATPVGKLMLWLLVIGFAGLTLWRLSEAALGRPSSDASKPSARVLCLVKAAIYAAVTYSIAKYALGLGAPSSTNQQSQDLTATALRHPGGQAVVAIAGAIIVGVGVYLAAQAYRRRFLRDLRFQSASTTTRKVVTWFGQVGGIARGVVFVTVGIFLVVAAVEARPAQAKGIDSALRELARTPFGPWLLACVAIGLVLFGAYSCCEARWRQV
jgi:Domain of Unknown Function (DUF1206)